jgi:tRNA (cmo5U34)-methyltransferase
VAEHFVRPATGSRTPEVGDGIRAPGGVWTFSGDTPRAFDEHIVRSVPAYTECHDLILDISDQLVPAGGRCYDLGCSTGTLTARLVARLAPRGVEVIGVDREPEMIERAAQRCAGSPSIRFVTSALEQLEPEPADLAVSFYTLQFVPPRHRQAVLERIRCALEPAGALILFEKVLAPTARGQDVADGVYFDFKRRQGFRYDEIAEKTRSLRGVLQPLSTDTNYAMLRRAGFTEIMQVFRWMIFDGVIAYASPTPGRLGSLG